MRMLSYALVLLAGAVTGVVSTPAIEVIVLSNESGVPDGWIDSTTRDDATKMCNELIASQSDLYANAISRSRCLIKVHKDE